MNLIIFLAGLFFLTFIIGKIIEKARIPWLFASLLIGFILSFKNPFEPITSSDSFLFLANLGMLFLLFIIGFELDLKELFAQGKFILKATTIIIIAETIMGSITLHYLFGLEWVIAIIVASSFATVGESVLLPILDEFNLTKTKLGQTILGVGVMDDFMEVITIIAATVIISMNAGHSNTNIGLTMIVLGLLFGLVFILVKFHKQIHTFKFKEIPSFFLFVLFFIFLFVGVGKYAESEALGAILAGIALRNIVPGKNLKYIDSEIRTMSYGFLAPIFLLWVGINTNLRMISHEAILIITIIIITLIAKVISSYLVGKNTLGKKKSIIMGLGLTVKLSTSIVIIKLLFEKGLINNLTYSVLISSTIFFTITVPIILPIIIKQWKIHLIEQQ